MRKNLTTLLTVLVLLAAFPARAQVYSGYRQFDGEHKHQVSAFLSGGSNVVTGFFLGQAGTYTYHFNPRWSISGGQQIQFFKQVYSLDVMGTYRIPIGKKTNVYIDGRVLFNRYQQWSVNETILNLSGYLETNYIDLRWGWSFVSYFKTNVKDSYKDYTDASYNEPLVMTFGFGVNIRPRSNPWNLGLFIRNYDQFYYENWNINWGLRFHATLTPQMKIYSEFNVRPAGSLSQLATRYETSLKVGLRYVW